MAVSKMAPEVRSRSPHSSLLAAAEVKLAHVCASRVSTSWNADVTGPCLTRKSQKALECGIGGGALLAPGKLGMPVGGSRPAEDLASLWTRGQGAPGRDAGFRRIALNMPGMHKSELPGMRAAAPLAEQQAGGLQHTLSMKELETPSPEP
ncbi:Hypothetical predicted protein, partial [Pelobates cultripes]